ncbi:DUF3558 domain-containing protein [Nocardia farcinica]|nr:DUF3558 domain-containing protein [Nocardia farcinica]MBF6280681.1 DUF3558 domain-containing protein [Nocardia farcinica]MBF6304861.1 DUF3558 domain-containing protein [Nocardia farcinica]MBF6390533.1 DUF3558 domain-containing protein [Nocardia farcinica]MBF6494127.1 DUF3558 domain-containing protein [Nocardia farcinica]
MSVGSPAVGRGRRSRSAPRCPRIPASEGCWMGSRSVVGGVLALGVVVVLGGCDSSVDGDAGSTESTTATVAADVPTGFDPCEDIPQSVLDSENLTMKLNADSDVSGGIKWRGCRWVQPDGYAASIRITNITVDMVRSKNFPDARETSIDGRAAITSRQVDEHPEAVCTLNVEMRGGSLELNLSNPPSRKNTGSRDTCALTTGLAQKVVPAIPDGA